MRNARSAAMLRAARALAVAFIVMASSARLARAGENIVVHSTAVEPAVLRTTSGERVDFVNGTGRAVHVEFKRDVRRHQVVQTPATGPIWVVFHRPGTHPYVIHVYEPKERTLSGMVEVTESPLQPWDSSTCGITAMGLCIEP